MTEQETGRVTTKMIDRLNKLVAADLKALAAVKTRMEFDAIDKKLFGIAVQAKKQAGKNKFFDAALYDALYEEKVLPVYRAARDKAIIGMLPAIKKMRIEDLQEPLSALEKMPEEQAKRLKIINFQIDEVANRLRWAKNELEKLGARSEKANDAIKTALKEFSKEAESNIELIETYGELHADEPVSLVELEKKETIYTKEVKDNLKIINDLIRNVEEIKTYAETQKNVTTENIIEKLTMLKNISDNRNTFLTMDLVKENTKVFDPLIDELTKLLETAEQRIVQRQVILQRTKGLPKFETTKIELLTKEQKEEQKEKEALEKLLGPGEKTTTIRPTTPDSPGELIPTGFFEEEEELTEEQKEKELAEAMQFEKEKKELETREKAKEELVKEELEMENQILKCLRNTI